MTLPALGESVTEGTVSRWLKQVGDTVEADEALLEISTDKVDTEIPSPVAGTILEIQVAEDETVEVGAVLAVIGDASQASESAPEAEAPANETAQVDSADTIEEQTAAGDEGGQEPIPAKPEQSPSQSPSPKRSPSRAQGAAGRRSRSAKAEPAGDGEGDRSYVTPLVRKLAAEHSVDLAVGHRHRRRRPDPQAGRAGRCRGGQEGGRGTGCRSAPAAPSARRPRRRSRRPSRATCAAPPRRCRGCARPSPSGWSSRCRSRPSSPRPSRST